MEILEEVTGLMEDVILKKRGLFSRVLKEDEVKIKQANAQELLKRVRQSLQKRISNKEHMASQTSPSSMSQHTDI